MFIDNELVLERLNRYRGLKMVYPLLECECGDRCELLLEVEAGESVFVRCSECGESRRVPLMFLNEDVEETLSIMEIHERRRVRG